MLNPSTTCPKDSLGYDMIRNVSNVKDLNRNGQRITNPNYGRIYYSSPPDSEAKDFIWTEEYSKEPEKEKQKILETSKRKPYYQQNQRSTKMIKLEDTANVSNRLQELFMNWSRGLRYERFEHECKNILSDVEKIFK